MYSFRLTCGYNARVTGHGTWLENLPTVCHKVLYTKAYSILGDSGAVNRVGRKGATKVFNYGRKSRWVPTLTELFPKNQADAGSWLGTKNALYYCVQSANSFSWVLFVSSYTTAIVSIAACVAMHAVGKLSVWYKSPIWFQNTVCPKTKDAFPKIQAWAYNRYSRLHRSCLA